MSIPYTKMSGWREIAETFTERAEGMYLGNKEDFYYHMLSMGAISNDTPLFCPRAYAYFYNIRCIINQKKKDWFTVICGLEGTGKSLLAIQAAASVSPTFCMDNITYNPYQFFSRIKTANPGDTVIMDEAVLTLYSTRSTSEISKDIKEIFQMMRRRYLHVILCMPRFRDMDKYIRTHRADTLIQIRKMGDFRFYNREGIQQININYPSRCNNLFKVRVKQDYWIDSTNYKGQWPIINDISEKSYELHKKNNEISNLDEKLGKYHKKYEEWGFFGGENTSNNSGETESYNSVGGFDE